MVSRFRFNAFAMGAVMLVLLCASGLARATVSSLDVDQKAVPSAGSTVVTVTGSLVCTAGDAFEVSVLMLQGKSGTQGNGSSLNPLTCTGAGQDYSVDVPVLFPSGGEYANGPATVRVTGFDITDGTVDRVIEDVVIAGSGK